MSKLAYAIILSWGWKRRAIAFASGAVGVLAMAPFGFFPAMFVPLMTSIWLIDGSIQNKSLSSKKDFYKSLSHAAEAGWWLGFGFFVAGLWWLGAAVLAEADKFAWALPLAIFGLPAVLAVFTSLGFMLAACVWPYGVSRIFVFAVALSATEYLRGNVLTGFPWNDIGMSLGTNVVLAQLASVIGLHGLTLLAALIFAMPAAAFSTHAGRGNKSLSPLIISLALLALLGAFGAWRLSGPAVPNVQDVRLRLVQPNAPQDDSFRSDNRDAIVTNYLALSDRATSPTTSGIADATHLIWPESAFPFILSRDRNSLERIGAALHPGAVLITGAARASEPEPGHVGVHYFNAVQVVNSSGVVVDSYDKVHLVPFGEYIPFDSLLRKTGLQQFVHIPGGFEPGGQRRSMSIPGLPTVAPLICYEAIFSGEVMPQVAGGQRPSVMLNLTNDGWFGQTIGPYQHFSQTRLRSIEEGLPLVRVANTGISAIIDPYGRIMGSLPLGVSDVLDGPLPQAIPETLFAEYRQIPFMIMLLCSMLLAVGFRRRA